MLDVLDTCSSSVIVESRKDKVEMKRNNTNIKTINMSEFNYLAIKEIGHKASDLFNKVTITRSIANTK